MAININVQDEQVTVNVVKGEINTGKPPVLQEISITKDGTYTPDVGVDGFSKVEVFVLPTDMLDGLEDGWDVMFYDEHKRGLASYSIKQGHTINAPVYDCKGWQTADGENVTFPYTPTADVIFYALISTYADQLYEYYGIDKAVFPYVFIQLNQKTSTTTYVHISFNQTMNSETTFSKSRRKQVTAEGDFTTLTDIEKIMEWVMATVLPSHILTTVFGSDTLNLNTTYTVLTNYDFTQTASVGTYYSLTE